MENTLKDVLQLLGLSSKEIKFFVTSLQLGPTSINEIAKEAKLKRATAYLIFEDLIAKGLLEQDFKHYGKKVIALEPKRLLQLVASKQRQLRRKEIELEESLPSLQALYNTSESRPKVKVFEGNAGLFSIWKDILSTEQEILLWSNQDTETTFFDRNAHNKFIAERLQKKIQIKVLAVNNQSGKDLLKDQKKQMRQTKLLPEVVTFTAETYIYDNKIAILDYKKDVIGVLIESEPMAQSHKAMFEAMWSSLAD